MEFFNDEDWLNNYFRNEISAVKIHIKKYHETLNNEGIWLFLAALGCWGVTDKSLQKWSFYITLILFTFRVFQSLGDTRSYKKIYLDLSAEINESTLDIDLKNARLNDLNRLKSKHFSVWRNLKSMLIFIICFIFTIVSLNFNAGI